MEIDVGIAFRSRIARFGGEADYVLVEVADSEWVAAIANAYDGGFSVCWPAGSEAVLDYFRVAWVENASSERRTHETFTETAERFRSGIGAEPVDDEWEHQGGPAATLAVIGSDGEVCWIGGETVIHVRGGSVIAATSPHRTRAGGLRERDR